jgi:hypothetical protein
MKRINLYYGEIYLNDSPAAAEAHVASLTKLPIGEIRAVRNDALRVAQGNYVNTAKQGASLVVSRAQEALNRKKDALRKATSH